ncbi:glycine--tRNA ligase subunit beta [Sphingomonas sp. PP-CC-1A-547]|uniref:glycine--tRNA ligase subunit beta n=1 Tax=Sphingomonas sp. PP-CC-1A-547 TaxID=2135654 RepID=UPI000E751A06|nr:glycine--tRNA ligase subunit beta [Sphingomonas sp. PP-CC-1A-547]RKE45753.1 glycyl-tRNA synthetase beta chain [Sphingomonas sp. PP-CC-1A-547]
MTDFLLELRSEEIPARMQSKAREDLAKLFTAELAKAGIAASAIVTYATPRRLTLIARDLPLETAAVSEETKGPKTSAPPQALEGFLRKTGLTREQLVDRGGTLFAVTEKPGRATAAVLAEAIPAIVRAFPWPKSMRWGDASASTESLRWVRPLQGIVALLGEEIVPFEIAGIASGAATLGHRFHHPYQITIGGAHDYVEKLRACHVIVDHDERATLIRDHAREAAAQAGLELIEDEGLVAENAGLTEWPIPLLGQFDPAFLDVPPEVIQLTARVNQKYFVCRGTDGKLANAFVCTANIAAHDGGAKIVEGNRKVLAARLSDAKFFYDTDLKVPLEEQAEKLSKIVFHEKLGTVADKVDRVAQLARWLVEEGIILPGTGRGTSEAGGGGAPRSAASAENPLHPQPAADGPPPLAGEELATHADRAARLAKADLVTGMVGEFPELQGLMGGYYAAAQGEHPSVATAIRDHYKPVGQGDDVPTDPVTVAVSLADKLDTIASFFAIDERPTGSKDPYALRRAVLGGAQLIVVNGLRLPLTQPYSATWLAARLHSRLDNFEQPHARDALRAEYLGAPHEFFRNLRRAAIRLASNATDDEGLLIAGADLQYTERKNEYEAYVGQFLDFFADRLKVQQREAGVRHDLIDAVFALGGEDDLVRLLARVHALQAFVTTEDGANLLAGYKRAANILKKEAPKESAASSAPIPEKEGPGVGSPRGNAEPASDRPTPNPSLPGRGEEEALSYTPEPAETALMTALDSAEPRATAAIEREDFAAAMAALASLRAPIDAFFDSVIVNDSDPAKRSARLALLERVRAAVHNVADFSKIEG